MDYIKAKIYEFLIKREIKKLNYLKIKFEYSLLIKSGFTELFIKPNTHSRVTVYYGGYRYSYYSRERHKTFKNIEQAYKYFKF